MTSTEGLINVIILCFTFIIKKVIEVVISLMGDISATNLLLITARTTRD